MDIANFHGLSPFLMNEADGGEGGGAGGGALAVVDTSTDLATTGDTALETADDGGDQSGTGETALATAGDRQPANAAVTLLRQSADPEVKKYLNTATRAIAARTELGKLFPGQSPIAAVKALQQDMVGLAGRYYNTPDPRDPERRTGIQQIRDKMAEFEEIDLLFYGGDPRILEGMTSDDDGKAAFAKLAPAMMSKWRQIAPNAWAAATARQILADLKEGRLTDEKGNEVEDADIPMRIRRLYSVLKSETPTPQDLVLARNEVVAMANYLQRVQGLAALAPETFVTTSKDGDSKLQDRERRLAERESEQKTREWGNARQIMADQVIGRTFRQLTKGHEIAPDDHEDMQALFVRRFDAAVKAKEPRADDHRKGYLESEDREGYLAYEKYLVDTYGIPALKTEVERMLKRMAPAKPGTPRASVAAPGTSAKPAPTPAGFFKLSAKPPNHVIDNNNRTRDMIFKKQAVLRIPHEGKPAGSKVTW